MALLEEGIENLVELEKEEVQSTAITNFVDDGKVPGKSNPKLLRRILHHMTNLKKVYYTTPNLNHLKSQIISTTSNA